MANEMNFYRGGRAPLLDALSEAFFEPVTNVAGDSNMSFKTDIKETDNDYVVTAELPGLQKSDIGLKYQDDTLSIAVKRESQEETKDDDGKAVLSERYYGAMSRSYVLPHVAIDDIKASYENGILTVTLPKADEAQVNNIDIQ
ncbi:Hsp20/alpha crystallin family protein [Weissella halotolerans]|uniref:SHSP domain-containing protein n=1 Tax=Weissella halotolerans DSM 20190 TaxID=1123500 RepID=A0A0R2G6R6_9LACO|nr:Hsp20/alpha crystallin family protein [Weissella halotolerans]KRN32413.1 hypothetical protein IV68_GL000765 [Weissella halotolerans DSM 20190]